LKPRAAVTGGPELPFTDRPRCCAAARYTCRSLRLRNHQGRELTVCGLSRLMLVQRNFPTRDNQISQPDAAAQHRFPKAAIELVQIGRNPNRSYAAPVTDVSHAGLCRHPILVLRQRSSCSHVQQGSCCNAAHVIEAVVQVCQFGPERNRTFAAA